MASQTYVEHQKHANLPVGELFTREEDEPAAGGPIIMVWMKLEHVLFDSAGEPVNSVVIFPKSARGIYGSIQPDCLCEVVTDGLLDLTE